MFNRTVNKQLFVTIFDITITKVDSQVSVAGCWILWPQESGSPAKPYLINLVAKSFQNHFNSIYRSNRCVFTVLRVVATRGPVYKQTRQLGDEVCTTCSQTILIVNQCCHKQKKPQ